MAALGDMKMKNAEFLNPYQTTYHKEYFERDTQPADAERPGSSQGFTASYGLSEPIGDTTYGTEFSDKGYMKPEQIRTGSSSGHRKNNPHPLKAFMVWKFPKGIKGEQPNSEWATQLTDEMMDKVCRGKTKSTYQSDFMGIPQGFQVKEAFDVKDDWRSNVPYTLDSCKRWSYQKPNQQAILKENTTRYGCNKNKTIPVAGTVPTVSMRQLHLKKSTTYEREYNNRLRENIQGAKEYQRIYPGTENLRRSIEATGTSREKSALQGLIKTSRALGSPGRVTSRGREETPKWMSSFVGPM
ncbi:unnamed protein product [Owenia fusiformis]|nr:unnamed protein product [Owenia fusiformis]